MIMEIGITAGEIWKYLERNGQVSIENVYRDVARQREIILMSIGWLAREGHIILIKEKDSGSGYLVSLRRD
jgi:hypothetical protein